MSRLLIHIDPTWWLTIPTVLFLALFVTSTILVFLPGNRERYRRAESLPLHDEAEQPAQKGAR